MTDRDYDRAMNLWESFETWRTHIEDVRQFTERSSTDKQKGEVEANRKLIAVMLGSPSSAVRSAKTASLFERGFTATLNGYTRTLDLALRYRTWVLGVAILSFVATVWFYMAIPKGFFPDQDTGVVIAITEICQSCRTNRPGHRSNNPFLKMLVGWYRSAVASASAAVVVYRCRSIALDPDCRD